MPISNAKQIYASFSICIEAIREPIVQTSSSYGYGNYLEFNVCLEHGRTAVQRHPDTCKTVEELFEPHASEILPHPHAYQNCRVLRHTRVI